MATRNQAKARTRRTSEEIVRAVLDKTIENGATAGEERAAVAKAEQLIAKHRLDRSKFQFPPDRSLPANRGKRRTIREACEGLIRLEPALSYDEILSRVRAEFRRLQDNGQVPALLRDQDARAGRAGAKPSQGEP